MFSTHCGYCSLADAYLSRPDLDKGFDDTREGQQRPGHFRGVATIVAKLLNIVQPTRAYFGQKDATQCALIRRMVDDMNIDVTIQVESTVREIDGLAMSSRNAYLSPAERAAAPIIYQSLSAARDVFDGLVEGHDSVPAQALEEIVRSKLSLEPLVSDIQYVAIDDKLTMLPLATVQKEAGAVVSIACKIGHVRLIDNVILQ